MSKLVIVESPGKIKKIQSYLGKPYVVKASFGHIRDLDPKELSVDIENNFKPNYIVSKDKTKVVSELKKISSQCVETILAADQDREGEAIAESLKEVLKLKNPKRMIFTEITKAALEKAASNPTLIDKNQVYAQQTRRILDRIVGYQISPLLWKYLPGTKSAGRVQSVLVRILIDKENKVRESNSELRVKIYGEFSFKRKKINSTLYKGENIKEFSSLEKPKKLLGKIKDDDKFYIEKVITSETKKNPPPPFITSTLQQEASYKLRFPTKKTMMVAQKLYEKGLITYMRTDSTVLSKAALGMIKKYVIEKYGEKYSQTRNYTKNKKNAQEAHEAIRPTKLDVNVSKLSADESKLFTLIMNRTLASQMSSALILNQKLFVKCSNKHWKNYHFQTIINNVKFDGYLIIYNNMEENDTQLIKINEKDELKLEKLTSTEDYQAPPKRLNEAGLVSYLEKKGIGRPSTYASLISKILDRKYIEVKNIAGEKRDINFYELTKDLVLENGKKSIAFGSEKNKLVPTDLGVKTNDFLLKYFDNILEENFTAHLEEQLDKIASGKLFWTDVLGEFYQNFKPIIKSLEDKKVEKKEDNDELLGEIDGKKIYRGKGKYGPYVKCEDSSNGKWKFASFKGKKITLEEANELLKYPKMLGKKGNTLVSLNKGEYGYYIKYGTLNYSLPKSLKENKIEKMDLKEALEYLAGKGDENVIKGIIHKSKLILVKKGPYGNYIQTTFKGKKMNIKLGEEIPEDEEIIEKVMKKLK